MCDLHVLSCVWLFAALWTIAPQIPLWIKFSRQENGRSLPFSFPRDLPDPGIEPTTLASPKLAGRFFTTSATLEAQYCVRKKKIKSSAMYEIRA